MAKNKLERAVFAVSAVLVASVVGYLAYSAATIGDTPPDVRVRLGAVIEQQGGAFVVPVAVTNDGDEMAQAVEIEVTLEKTDRTTENAGFEIEFVPRRATREGWVTFAADPRAGGRLGARVLGYEKP